MEASALKHPGIIARHGASPLLRLQSDERLIALTRRGSHAAFEALVGRYSSRLLAFCRHMVGSREDAEDVLQEVLAAAFNAIVADDRPIAVRPWLYRIARNRSLNHLRRTQAIGVDSMDTHFSEHGATTADKVHRREDFRLLMADVGQLPETQRTALLLREMDALSYDQIAEAMETTVPSIKSLLVRARVSLAEAAEARQLSCAEVRLELGEVAEGLKRTTAPVRRHMRACDRCSAFRTQLRHTNRGLAAVYPVGALLLVKKLVLTHVGMSAGAGSGAGGAAGTATTASAVGAGAGATTTMGGGIVSAGMGALATKAAAGLAAAGLVTAGAVEVNRVTSGSRPQSPAVASVHPTVPPVAVAPSAPVAARAIAPPRAAVEARPRPVSAPAPHLATPSAALPAPPPSSSSTAASSSPGDASPPPSEPSPTSSGSGYAPPSGTQTESDTTTLPGDPSGDGQAGSSDGGGSSSGGAAPVVGTSPSEAGIGSTGDGSTGDPSTGTTGGAPSTSGSTSGAPLPSAVSAPSAGPAGDTPPAG